MSLIVYAYKRDPHTGKERALDEHPTPPQNDLAGFESWRSKVWAADLLKDLGLQLLPSLAVQDVFAEGNDLDQLLGEVDIVTHDLAALAASTDVDEDGLRFRLKNVREAIRLARQVPNGEGGVYIGCPFSCGRRPSHDLSSKTALSDLISSDDGN